MSSNEEQIGFLVCQICSEKFIDPDELLLHLEAHADEFFDSSDPEEEIVTARKIIPRTVKCTQPTCRRKFRDIKGLTGHLISAHHIRMERITCPDCNFVGRNNSVTRSHIKREACKKPQIPRKTAPKSIKCTQPNCRRNLRNITGLRIHLQQKHGTQLKPLTCPDCGFQGDNYKMTRNHIDRAACKRNHIILGKDEWKMAVACSQSNKTCVICTRRLSSASALNYHLRTHLKKEERPDVEFVCQLCKQAFPDENAAEKHVQETHPD